MAIRGECEAKKICFDGTYVEWANTCLDGRTAENGGATERPGSEPVATPAAPAQPPAPVVPAATVAPVPTPEPDPPRAISGRVYRNSSKDGSCRRSQGEPNAWAVSIEIEYYDEAGSMASKVPVTLDYGRNGSFPTERETFGGRWGNATSGTVQFQWCFWGDFDSAQFQKIHIVNNNGISSYPPINLTYG